ncbi:hypothetical protein BH09ACT8_BH09ACT8_27100 [soil metagenome]
MVSQAQQWRPDALCEVADAWDDAAGHLQAEVDELRPAADESAWTGAAAAAAADRLVAVDAAATAMARGFVAAAVAARDGAARLTAAREAVSAAVAAAGDFRVDDDGTVRPSDAPVTPLLLLTSGGDEAVARLMMATRASELTERIQATLDDLGAADAETARDIDEAFGVRATPGEPTRTQPAGVGLRPDDQIVAGWPTMRQDDIAGQIAAMPPAQRQHLVDTMPAQVGNTDGVPQI